MVKQNIKKLKQKIQPKQSKPILCDPNSKSYLEVLHKRSFFVLSIKKTVSDFAFIFRTYYVSKLLTEVGLSDSKSKTYLRATHSIDEIIQANINYCKEFDLNVTELDETLPIVY